MRRDVFADVVDDVLLEDVAVLADDVGAGQLAGAVVGHAHHRHVVHAFVPPDQILKFRRGHLRLIWEIVKIGMFSKFVFRVRQ